MGNMRYLGLGCVSLLRFFASLFALLLVCLFGRFGLVGLLVGWLVAFVRSLVFAGLLVCLLLFFHCFVSVVCVCVFACLLVLVLVIALRSSNS